MGCFFCEAAHFFDLPFVSFCFYPVHIQRDAFIALRLHQVGIFLPFAVLHKGQADFGVWLHVLPGDDVLLEQIKIFRIEICSIISDEIQLDMA